VRKMLGGMRQAGILAAAGLYALKHHIDRLAEDHEHARMLHDGLKQFEPELLQLEPVETNIIIFTLTRMDVEEFARKAREQGVLVHAIGPRWVRLVTHLDVSRDDVLQALRAFEQVLRGR